MKIYMVSLFHRATINESKHSEMGPVRQNPIQRTVRSVHMCVHRRREMYTDHARLSVYVSVYLSAAACQHYCTDPDVTWGMVLQYFLQ